MKRLLVKINSKLNAQGGFLKAVSVLVSGTLFAQGISVLTLPILTRLYSPKDFSLFAVYTSLLMILSVASCLRFEIAIPIPKDNDEAIHLVLLSLISNFIISIFTALIILIFHNELIRVLKQPDFSILIWLIPIGVFFSGIYNTLQYWAIRKKKFTTVTKTRMIQSISGVFVQVSMGLGGSSAIGLVIGQIFKVSAGIWRLAIDLWNDTSQVIRGINLHHLKQSFKKNDNFPKYSTLEALANSAGIQLPVILIAALSIGTEAGYLMLAMQIMAIPMGFIGGAVGQVYLAHAPEKYLKGELNKYTYQCILQLIKIGALPLIIICILAPFFIPFIFGSVWQRTGEMMLWMLPWFMMQLLVSPVSMSLNIIGSQKVALILQLCGLFIRCGGLWLLSLYSVKYIFEYYVLSGFVFYIIYFFMVSFCLRGK